MVALLSFSTSEIYVAVLRDNNKLQPLCSGICFTQCGDSGFLFKDNSTAFKYQLRRSCVRHGVGFRDISLIETKSLTSQTFFLGTGEIVSLSDQVFFPGTLRKDFIKKLGGKFLNNMFLCCARGKLQNFPFPSLFRTLDRI